MKRRDFLRAAAGGAAGFLAGCERLFGDPRPDPPAENAASPADVELVLRAGRGRVSILGDAPTDVWRFAAELVTGPRETLSSGAGYLGPTLRLRRGQRVRVHLDNQLDETTIVHWHGLYVSERNDGHPSQVIDPGGRYVYDFEVDNRAGTYWYHPHPVDRTGPQVYRGLAGLLLVSDDQERRAGLPDGDRELLLVLQDRTFDRAGQLVYEPDPMVGFLGDTILISGERPRLREVARGPHRLRILNGCNSRIFDLGWSDGTPMTILGTDGGLLAAPRQRDHIALAPGQRVDLWADFGRRPGADVWLESRAFTGAGMMGGMGMGMGMGRGPMGRASARVENGAPLRLQRFVATGGGSPGRPPDTLSSPAIDSAPTNAGRPRTFSTQMHMMRWLLNGRRFEMRGVAANERVRLGTVEDWVFENRSHMAMAHPIHLHGAQFRVVERTHGTGARSLRDGLFDEGWRDTFLLLPGDRVRIRVGFPRHAGTFLYHCHNLEHEDMGMMRNYRVEA